MLEPKFIFLVPVSGILTGAILVILYTLGSTSVIVNCGMSVS